MTLVLVKRFGGSRSFDPPAWGILEKHVDRADDVTVFHGCPAQWFGPWFLDLYDSEAYWEVRDEDVPDEVWAALAKWRMLDGSA